MEKKIAVIKGDGIGPEIVDEAIKALNKTAEVFGHKFEYRYVLMGGCAIDETGVPLPDETVEKVEIFPSKLAVCQLIRLL